MSKENKKVEELTEQEAFEMIKKSPDISPSIRNMEEISRAIDLDAEFEEEYVWAPKGDKYKKIDDELYAYEVKNLGVLINDGNGVTFIPQAIVIKDQDGNYDLVKGRF